jgi:hypothetical protein
MSARRDARSFAGWLWAWILVGLSVAAPLVLVLAGALVSVYLVSLVLFCLFSWVSSF